MKKVKLILMCALLLSLCCIHCYGCEAKELTKDNIKIGFIFFNGEDSVYDKNFMDSARAVQKQLGLRDNQIVFRENIQANYDCYLTATELAEQGCNVIFANSSGHEDPLLQVAMKYPDIEFCHASGTKAHTVGLNNFHNAFASIYEGRYLTGIVAGLKLNEMIENGQISSNEAILGYVGAFPCSEVKSGYTAYFLGARSVCPSVTMKVNFTGSWFDEEKEKQNAISLMDKGARIISQHADSTGAPSASDERGVPNISYNGGLTDTFPDTHIVSTKINWTPYFKYMIECKLKNEKISTDWTGTLATGSVELTEINRNVMAEGTIEAVEQAKRNLLNGSLKVFDTKNFTVKGETLTSYMADVNADTNFTPDTEVIKNGIFEESKYRSAPYFDIDVDGVEIVIS